MDVQGDAAATSRTSPGSNLTFFSCQRTPTSKRSSSNSRRSRLPDLGSFIESSHKITKNSRKIYKLEENRHPYAVKSEAAAKVVRKGNEVHVSMTMIRSHFAPDNIEGIQVGDKVFFHVTNLEQDYDVPHGISMMGANTSELLIMPGQTETFTWEPKQVGVWPFYCTDFCSALHQEMQGYVRVSAKGSSVPISFTLDGEAVDTK